MEPINQFWTVQRRQSGRHETLGDAISEAERLAANDPGATFFVLAAVSAVRAPAPVEQVFHIEGGGDKLLRPWKSGGEDTINAGLPPVKLRAGAFYLRRDGEVTGPMMARCCRAAHPLIYPWQVQADGVGHTYTNEGYYKSGCSHPFDIIAECDKGGWVQWRGGESPVPGSIVDCRRVGWQGAGQPCWSDMLRWRFKSGGKDCGITEFRVVFDFSGNGVQGP